MSEIEIKGIVGSPVLHFPEANILFQPENGPEGAYVLVQEGHAPVVAATQRELVYELIERLVVERGGI